MFRWPRTDDPLEWFIGALPGFFSWLAHAAADLFLRLVRAVAGLFSGRGTFTQWVLISLFVAASLLLLDALTLQSLRLRH